MGGFEAAPAANLLMAPVHACLVRLTKPHLLSFPSLLPSPLFPHRVEELLNVSPGKKKNLSSQTEQLGCVTFSPLLCISGFLLYFGPVCGEASYFSPPYPCGPFVPPTRFSYSTRCISLSLSCLPLFLWEERTWKMCEDFTPIRSSHTISQTSGRKSHNAGVSQEVHTQHSCFKIQDIAWMYMWL